MIVPLHHGGFRMHNLRQSTDPLHAHHVAPSVVAALLLASFAILCGHKEQDYAGLEGQPNLASRSSGPESLYSRPHLVSVLLVGDLLLFFRVKRLMCREPDPLATAAPPHFIDAAGPQQFLASTNCHQMPVISASDSHNP
ncbi:hypothetical protein M011DRAFT_475227 [Sporormia fimetaria CBS 119925]|uniref:Uncharacterized protein n=1 Tax=Sporormia fimetaria CBS 119925 TaxID=1340428 RepID=A0A6A6VK22_9PLEO|nr:hypothetical protein M011DRAFT_475227 [Sporormia fimetaria CBS 119925]